MGFLGLVPGVPLRFTPGFNPSRLRRFISLQRYFFVRLRRSMILCALCALRP
jgi:hypothetical protein